MIVLNELERRGEHRFRMQLGDLQRVLAHLGDPQLGVPAILIAGTNGKGSVAAFAESILRAHGLRTGRYTSPHLCHPTERIALDGRNIDPGDFAAAIARVIRAERALSSTEPAPSLTYFELLTAAAFSLFCEHSVDVAILEVGLGGRLDATRLCDARVCVLTNVALDHTEILGESLTQIAREKAGILRAGAPLVTAAEPEIVSRILAPACRELGERCHQLSRDFQITEVGGHATYGAPDLQIDRLRPCLAGRHQLQNVAVAIRTASLFSALDEARVRTAVAETDWPGRLQRLADSPLTLVDVAHNPAGAAALAAEIGRQTFAQLHLIFAVQRTKDWQEMLLPFVPLRPTVALTDAGTPLSLGPRSMIGFCQQHFREVTAPATPQHALACARQRAERGDLILAFGSHYLVGALLAGAAPLGSTDSALQGMVLP